MRRTSPPPKTIKLHVLLDDPTDRMLIELCNTTGQTKAHLLRGLIVARYTHTILRHPTCASGQRCYVPQMFANQAPPAPPPHIDRTAGYDPDTDSYMPGTSRAPGTPTP